MGERSSRGITISSFSFLIFLVTCGKINVSTRANVDKAYFRYFSIAHFYIIPCRCYRPCNLLSNLLRLLMLLLRLVLGHFK